MSGVVVFIFLSSLVPAHPALVILSEPLLNVIPNRSEGRQFSGICALRLCRVRKPEMDPLADRPGKVRTIPVGFSTNRNYVVERLAKQLIHRLWPGIREIHAHFLHRLYGERIDAWRGIGACG